MHHFVQKMAVYMSILAHNSQKVNDIHKKFIVKTIKQESWPPISVQMAELKGFLSKLRLTIPQVRCKMSVRSNSAELLRYF